jgi:excisionase family DNA binding protein
MIDVRTLPTAPNAAELLRLRVGMLRKLTRHGVVPHVRTGRSVRYVTEDIADWLRESRVERQISSARSTRTRSSHASVAGQDSTSPAWNGAARFK